MKYEVDEIDSQMMWTDSNTRVPEISLPFPFDLLKKKRKKINELTAYNNKDTRTTCFTFL